MHPPFDDGTLSVMHALRPLSLELKHLNDEAPVQ
jgi:hypothetical protein